MSMVPGCLCPGQAGVMQRLLCQEFMVVWCYELGT
jgi:hypothetical protein